MRADLKNPERSESKMLLIMYAIKICGSDFISCNLEKIKYRLHDAFHDNNIIYDRWVKLKKLVHYYVSCLNNN